MPYLWPLAATEGIIEAELSISARNMAFLAEEVRVHGELRPELASPNSVRLDLRTMRLRDYAQPGASGLPTLVVAPYAGHTAMIADFRRGQSLMETLLANGVARPLLTDWKPASEDMKDLEIDQYLAELNACVDDLGGRANLVGLCQGGWISAMLAARFPRKVERLVLAGSPIDTDAGDGPIKRLAHATPAAFYEELVALGGGLMRGATMLAGWKSMHPEQHALEEPLDLYRHIDDPDYVARQEAFARWYENPIDLPGRWYLQAITQLFKENRLARGDYVALGRRIALGAITGPVFLLAGSDDDITTPEQVFGAAPLLGTPPGAIRRAIVPGGHVGLFMGSRTLRETWPDIARWLAEAA